LLERLLGYRVFSDTQGKMNLSLVDIEGALLLVPQFTLVADTRKGMRPGFSRAATPELGQHLFDYLLGSGTGKIRQCSQWKIWCRYTGQFD
jgi:D-tyrosyl-tRNA(Tyr) deacylase